jgi:hypothetical protein
MQGTKWQCLMDVDDTRLIHKFPPTQLLTSWSTKDYAVACKFNNDINHANNSECIDVWLIRHTVAKADAYCDRVAIDDMGHKIQYYRAVAITDTDTILHERAKYSCAKRTLPLGRTSLRPPLLLLLLLLLVKLGLYTCLYLAPSHLLSNLQVSRSMFVPPPLFGPR